MPIKVLHVLHYSLPILSEGYAIRTHYLMRAQLEYGLDVVGLTGVTETEYPDAHIDGVRYLRTPARRYSGVRILRPLWRYRMLTERLDEVIEREKPSLIHVHSPAYVGLAGVRAAKRAGLPVVYEVRVLWEEAAVDRQTVKRWSPSFTLARGLETHVLRQSDAVVTICEGLKKEVVSRGIDANRVFVVPNGVRPEQFPVRDRDEELARSLGIGSGPVFGFIGSLFAYEGVEDVLDVMPAVAERLPNAQLLIVGSGHREEEIKRRVERWPKPGQVIYRNRVSHAEVQRYYSIVDCMVYARRSARITELVTPLKPLEAMAMRKAMVASDIDGHREYLSHRSNAFMFEKGNNVALTQAMCDVGSDVGLRKELGAGGRRFVEQQRTWSISVKHDLAAYERVLSRQLAASLQQVAP